MPDQPLPAPRTGEDRFRGAFRESGQPIPVLTDDLPIQVSGLAVRRYAPLTEETGLFREFAETPANRESVQRFAARYGLLGTATVPVEVQLTQRSDVVTVGAGEPLTAWQAEIASMSLVLDLWERAARGGAEELAGRFRSGADGVFYVGENGLTAVTALSGKPATDVVTQAKHFVYQTINNKLDGLVAPRLLEDPATGAADIHIVPANLIGSVWLQLAHSIREDRQFKQCRFCKKWFEVSLRAARKSRVYCGPACRMKEYRARKTEAQKWHAEGLSVEAISERLATSPGTIRAWLKAPAPRV